MRPKIWFIGRTGGDACLQPRGYPALKQPPPAKGLPDNAIRLARPIVRVKAVGVADDQAVGKGQGGADLQLDPAAGWWVRVRHLPIHDATANVTVAAYDAQIGQLAPHRAP